MKWGLSRSLLWLLAHVGIPWIFVEFKVPQGQGFVSVLFTAVSTVDSQPVFWKE